MEELIRGAAMAIVGVIFLVLLQRRSSELALLLSLGICISLGILALRTAKPLVDFLRTLQGLARLEGAILEPLLKTIAMGLVTQLASNLCRDGGQTAVARLIEICGGATALAVAIPLLEAVLDMLRSLGGG